MYIVIDSVSVPKMREMCIDIICEVGISLKVSFVYHLMMGLLMTGSSIVDVFCVENNMYEILATSTL